MDKERKLADYETLRAGYIKLINDKEVMLSWGKPQLEALYISKIGVLQIERLKLQLEIKSLKRKIELVYAAVNTNNTPDFFEIEITVAAQLAKAEKEIMQQTEKLEYAKQVLSNLESPERSSDLRKIFRSMAKMLHPDININQTKEQEDLWHKILEAYNTGDLERLKAYKIVYEKELMKTENDITSLDIDEIIIRCETLKEGIKVMENEIAHLNSQFPFNMKDKITNEEWVSSENGKLSNEIDKLKEYEKELNNEYANLRILYGK